jgi:ubiquinone/menaquinone biosynthesis C-methylase UbiE
VDAVEPDARMLAVLRREVPEATPHQARSDALPLDDACLDAVLVADAFHWFPVGRTLAEVGRVLKPRATNSAMVRASDAERTERAEMARAILHRAADRLGTATLPFRLTAACIRWAPR